MEKNQVSRSAFQKVSEENKKLKAEIRILVEGNLPEIILLKHKYKLEYEKEQALDDALRGCAKQYFKDNPKQDITSPEFDPRSLHLGE